jgi:uncharacterized membrane protein
MMNLAHLHLLLNHFPIIGTMIAVALFLLSFVGKNTDLRRASYIIFAGIALLSIPTFMSGYTAEAWIQNGKDVSQVLIDRHKGSAILSFWFMEFTGAFALVGLWQSQKTSRPANWNVAVVFLLSLLTVGMMARTGNTGGDIHHAELRGDNELLVNGKVVEGPIGSIASRFEPSPDKFMNAMVFSKWWWTFMMILHYMGLILIVATVGFLDLRIMGFMKQVPIRPVHEFIPWGMLGLGINVLTGMLGFIGQPNNYIFKEDFWMKILCLMLLGLNVALFYMTDVFEGVENVGAGEDAPIFAKLVAGTSLFLWFAVITFGRFIQFSFDTFKIN